MDQKVKRMDAKIQKVQIIVECLYEHIYGEEMMFQEMMFQEISDNSSPNPHSSSGEDSTTDSTSIASVDCDDSASMPGKQRHTCDSMPSHTKSFTVLMSDKNVSSDSDGGCAIAAIQESHITNSASHEEISRGAKKAITRASEPKLRGESQPEIQEFIAIHSKITRKYRNCKEDIQ